MRRSPPNAWLVAAAMVLLPAGVVVSAFPVQASRLSPSLLPLMSIAALAIATVLSRQWSSIAAAVGVLAGTLLIGWLRSPSILAADTHFIGAALGMLVMALIGVTADRWVRLSSIVVLVLCGGLAIMAAALAGSWGPELGPLAASWFAALPDLRLRLAGLGQYGYVNPNALAASALLVGPLGLIPLGRAGGWNRLARIAGVAVLVLAVAVLLLAHSRSGWAAAGATGFAALAYGVAHRPSAARRRWVAIAVVAIAVTSLTAFSLALATNRIGIAKATIAEAIGTRLEIMRAGVDLFRGSPWFGIGLNAFRERYQNAAVIDLAHAHNMFLQTALDLGIFGVAAYIWLLAALLWSAHSVFVAAGPWRSVAAGAALSLIAVHCFGLADAVALGARLGIIQWMAAGLILAAARLNRSLPHEAS